MLVSSFAEILFILLNIKDFLINTIFLQVLDLSRSSYNLVDLSNYCIDYPFFFIFGFFFLFSSMLSFLFFNYLGLYGTYFVNLISLLFFWLVSGFYFLLVFKQDCFFFFSLGNWMFLNTNLKVGFDFYIDNISLSFSFLTLTIALFVYIYSYSYFRYEPSVERLILFLNLFVASMVFLVSSGNLIMLFLGWELIGLTSFLLINFWATKVSTLKAAFKAFSFNKSSDLFIFFSIILIFNLTNSLDNLNFITKIHLYQQYRISFLTLFNYTDVISFFLLSAAFIKSAQIGAHIWLPDSMEAPVPASALIHSATLVSAGIYLILRFYTLFELNSLFIWFILIVGSITSLYGGLTAAFQSDIKRTLAYSTISHCGFLMVLCSIATLEYTVLYLYVHGFFKALVFLSVGNIIRFSNNNQDFRRMGLYYKFLPFDCFFVFIGLLNLGGLPFTLGFFIKHLLFVGLTHNFFLFALLLTLNFLAAITGIFYSYRLFYSVFFDFKKAKKGLYKYYNELCLNSKYYSNSNAASIISIFGLYITANIICLSLCYVYFNDFFNASSQQSYLIYSNYLDTTSISLDFLFNSSFVNIVVFMFIILAVFSAYRQSYLNSLVIDSLYRLLVFMVISLFFYKLI